MYDFFEVKIDRVKEAGDRDLFLQQTLIKLFCYHWDKRKKDISKLDLLPEQLSWYFDESKVMLLNWLGDFIQRLEKELKKGLKENKEPEKEPKEKKE